MSFWKHDPPNPTDGIRKFEPIRWSLLMTFRIYITSAPLSSHSAVIEFIEEIRCAKKALATNFDNSLDHTLAVKIRSLDTQCAYTFTNTSMSCAFSPPMSTRSGFSKSVTAVPSARNYGLLRTENVKELLCLQNASNIWRTETLQRTGTVLF